MKWQINFYFCILFNDKFYNYENRNELERQCSERPTEEDIARYARETLDSEEGHSPYEVCGDQSDDGRS